MSAIEVRNLSRVFGAFTAVDDVSFEVHDGEIFGYLGANGAGKSTTIRMLTGLLAPSSGNAWVSGHDIAREPESVKASLGYMSQKFSLYHDLTVRANLEFFAAAYGAWGKEARKRIDEAMARTSLGEIGGELTGSLSGGVQQRVALASAILHEPRIVFLDEPTAGVDPVARRDFWRLIRELASGGTTVFVTTHYMDEAEYCARIGLMVAGKLVALDTPAKLKATYAPGTVYELRGEGLKAAIAPLEGTPGVLDVSPFGAGIGVRVDPARLSRAVLEETLARMGVRGLEIDVTEPTLEDVFLKVTRHA